MTRCLSILFSVCLICVGGLLGTTHAWAQALAPPTLCDGNSVTYCASAVETPCLATCPTGTTLVASSTNGVITAEPSTLFPTDRTRILPPLSPPGLTTYTIVCRNSSGPSAPVTVDVTINPSPAPPVIVSNVAGSTVAAGATFSLTANCALGSTAVWDDDNTAGPIRTVVAPVAATVLSYEALCSTGQCDSEPEQIDITVVVSPGSPTLTFGTSATFCVPTESCGGVFLYNSVICPVGWLFSYRDPNGLQINTNAQSGPIEIPYAPSKPALPLRILNYTAICSNPSTAQTTSAPLTIYIANAPPAASLWIITKP